MENTYKYRAESDESATRAVVSAVVAYSEKEYNDLPELYDTIDSEALNRIFRSWNDPDVELTFRYAGNLITVYGTGKIVVRNSDSLTRYPDRD